MWEPENRMVVSSFWYDHHDDWYWSFDDDDEEEEEEDDMSVSKPMYKPEMCDGEPCPGDCDLCNLWQLWDDEEEDDDDE